LRFCRHAKKAQRVDEENRPPPSTAVFRFVYSDPISHGGFPHGHPIGGSKKEGPSPPAWPSQKTLPLHPAAPPMPPGTRPAASVDAVRVFSMTFLRQAPHGGLGCGPRALSDGRRIVRSSCRPAQSECPKARAPGVHGCHPTTKSRRGQTGRSTRNKTRKKRITDFVHGYTAGTKVWSDIGGRTYAPCFLRSANCTLSTSISR